MTGDSDVCQGLFRDITYGAVVKNLTFTGVKFSGKDCVGVAIGVIYDVEDGVLTQVSTLDSESGNYGDGTSSDPYIICSEDDLKAMIGDRLDDDDNLEHLCFELGAPITLTSSFKPMGQNGLYGFKGSLNGGSLGNDTSNAISNLTCMDYTHAGLFYKLAEGASISNLTLSNFLIQGTNNLGAIAAYGYGGSISNVKLMSGNIMGEESVGGFIGSGILDVITDCKNYANIIATADGGSNFGGYIGYLNNPDDSEIGGEITISNSTFDGFISASGSEYVGGLIGYLGTSEDSQYITITDSSIEMGVDSSNKNDAVVQTKDGFSYIGGLAGYVHNVGFKYSSFENNGARVGSSDSAVDYVGGIIGDARNRFQIYNSCNVGDITSSGGDMGGIVGMIHIEEDVMSLDNDGVVV